MEIVVAVITLIPNQQSYSMQIGVLSNSSIKSENKELESKDKLITLTLSMIRLLSSKVQGCKHF